MHESSAPSRNEISADAATTPTPRTGDRRGLRRLADGFLALVALTVGLIVLGALVRANHAGLACPDWPLCFGDVIPQMNLEVAFEWTHRLIAGAVSLAFIGLAVPVLRRPDVPRSAEILLVAAAGLLVAQILLGALTVWLRLAPWTVTAHLIIGNGFSLTLLLIAGSLRDAARGRPPRPRVAPAARRLVLASAALLLLQLLLGGLMSSRYAGPACPEWPTCSGGVWIPTWSGIVGLHLLHRLNGYALLAALMAAAAASRRDPNLRRLTGLALALGLGEIAAGVANVWLGIPAEITGLHTGLAAALVLALGLALRDIFTRTAPEPMSWRPVAACAAVLLALGCARAPRPECVPDPPPGVVGSVCGFRNPEDVAAVPSARMLLVSQMRHDDSEQGGSIAALPLGVDGAPAGPPRTLWPPASPEQRAETAGSGAVGETGCTAAPSAKRFAPHGISVGLPRADGSLPVAVVAHDPREAIELFELIPTGGAHRLRWSGCVPLPPGTTGNDVALAPDGSLLVTNFTPRSSGPVAIYYALRSGLGLATGDVLARPPGGEWAHVSGTAAAYPNGIARSPDGAGFYLAETGTGRIAKLDFSAPSTASELGSVQIGGHPDNLAWSPRGPLLAVSHTSGAAFLLCAFGRRPCRSAWSLFEIDAEELVARELLACDGAAVGGVASVAEVGGRFYFGAVFDDRIGVWQPRER